MTALSSIGASTRCLVNPPKAADNPKIWQKINNLSLRIPFVKFAEGAQGEVWGSETENMSPVVVKVFSKKKHYDNESKILQIAHGTPYLVVMRAAGQIDGRYVIVLNNAGKCDFLDFINDNEKILEEDTLLLARQSLECLDGLHARGVIHCDLKPENVIVRFESGDLKFSIADLGLSITFNDKENLTRCKKGTLSYASPELALSLKCGPEIDIWGLGYLICMAQGVGLLEFDPKLENKLKLLQKMEMVFGEFPQEMIKKAPDEVRRWCFKEVKVLSEGQELTRYKLKEPDFDWPCLEEIMEENEFPELVKYLLRKIFTYENRPTAKDLLKEIIQFKIQVPKHLKKSTLTIKSNKKLNNGVIQTVKKTVKLSHNVFQIFASRSENDVYEIITQDSSGKTYKGYHVILDEGILAL